MLLSYAEALCEEETVPKQVDTERLRAFFREQDCLHVIAFIDFLESPRGEGLLEIGSGTIDFDNVMNEVYATAKEKLEAVWFKTYSLYIGSRDGSVTPLEWLLKLSKVFADISPQARYRFNIICQEIVAITSAPAVRPVVIADKFGHRTITAKEFNRTLKEKYTKK